MKVYDIETGYNYSEKYSYEDKNENLKVVYTCNCRKEAHHE